MAKGDAGYLTLQSLLYPFSLYLSSLISNGLNLPLSPQTICARMCAARVCVAKTGSLKTVRKISRATLRQASPAATKGNCFLIKPRALIPMIFSRHEVAHTHTHTFGEEVTETKRGRRSTGPTRV